jgi:hypothetical protein
MFLAARSSVCMAVSFAPSHWRSRSLSDSSSMHVPLSLWYVLCEADCAMTCYDRDRMRHRPCEALFKSSRDRAWQRARQAGTLWTTLRVKHSDCVAQNGSSRQLVNLSVKQRRGWYRSVSAHSLVRLHMLLRPCLIGKRCDTYRLAIIFKEIYEFFKIFGK